MHSKKRISIFGVTGSVGKSAYDIIASCPQNFEVDVVTANKNVEELAECALSLNAKVAVIAQQNLENELKERLKGSDIAVYSGSEALESAAARPCDLMIAAIVGFAGLRPIIKALESGTNVAIANKEPLVAAGNLVISTAQKSGAKILPVDSEHNAIFQVWEESNRKSIECIILTASGGPFLNWSSEDIANATVAQATAHPNWNMGQKISIDSATMMNKALEIIEASYLFNLAPEQIKVLIHPQSIIHSMVTYADGSTLAQLGASDMRTPLSYVMAWPERMTTPGRKLEVKQLKSLTFQEPDYEKHTALTFAYNALTFGPSACIALNAANEVAVSFFLDNQIGFTDIISCVGKMLDDHIKNMPRFLPKTIEEIEKLDQTVRRQSTEYINHYFSCASQKNKTLRK